MLRSKYKLTRQSTALLGQRNILKYSLKTPGKIYTDRIIHNNHHEYIL